MEILRHLPTDRKPTALTIGNFDGVHLGHRAVLDRLSRTARERGWCSCVMTFEPHPREFFAPDQAPTRLTSLREKLELLRGAGVERTFVCRFNYDLARVSAVEFIDRFLWRGLDVRWLLVGDDFRFGARRQGDFTLLAEAGNAHGFEAEQLQAFLLDGERVSSTAVRQRLAAGDLAAAAQLLGRAYSMSGRVVRGDRLGRELGFPTANIQMRHNRPPLCGIFVVEVAGLSSRSWPGVASLGLRPTVKQDAVPVLEVHLLDFNSEIYGQHLNVRFLRKLREEKKYATLDELTAQIASDVAEARFFFQSAVPLPTTA